MEHQHDATQSGGTEHPQLRHERDAQDRLLHLGAADLPRRPWRPDPMPPTAVDLVQFALWKSADLTADDLSSALALLPAARAEVEGTEIGLVFNARAAGLTWAQIAEAMGFRSPQACQQYVTRLSTKRSAQ